MTGLRRRAPRRSPRRGRPALYPFLAVVSVAGLVSASPAAARQAAHGERSALVILVDRISFEDLLLIPSVRLLARDGGTALMSSPRPLRPMLWEQLVGLPSLRILDLGAVATRPSVEVPGEDEVDGEEVQRLDAAVRAAIAGAPDGPVLVVVATPSGSTGMQERGDELTGVAMAVGTAGELGSPIGLGALPGSQLHPLTSDSTRRSGVVVADDVPATVLGFLGGDAPATSDGSLMRRAAGAWPFQLHQRYLAYRRMTVPVGAAAGIFVTLLGMFGIGVVAFRRRLPPWLVRGARWAPVSVLPLSASLLAAGHLPTLSYATVVPFLAGVTVISTLAVVPLGRRDPFLPPVVLGAAILVFFALEALLGWTAALTPFLGGGQLDGGRFFGLPNVFIGLLLGSAVFVATRLSPRGGFLLLLAAALFAGLPWTGANLGASVTIFLAAGVWLSLRVRGRLDARGVLVALATAIVGTATVVIAHRFLASTHVTAFVEAGGSEHGGVLGTIAYRLSVGFRLLVRNPFALIPTLGAPAVLLVTLRPSAAVRNAVERHPIWREAVLTVALGSVAAYLLNDSGPAAIGLGFATSLAALVLTTLVVVAEEPR